MKSNGDATRLEMAHVLFMDVVGYTRLSLERQGACIQQLQALVRGTPTFQQAEADGFLLSHPSGDGMALAFFDDPTAPVRCALEIADRMRGGQNIELRMGVHSGPVTRGEDINGMPNVRGQAINMANRVMDCGDAGHILVSRSAGDILSELTRWAEALVDLGEAEIKHGESIGLYSLVDGGLGNPARPSRLPSAALEPVEPTPPSGAHVALLYRRNAQPDGAVLDALDEHLREAGHTVFIDRHMTVGIEWAREIEGQIRAADIVVALLSASSVRSEMLDYEVRVAHEAAQAQDGRPRMLPIRVDYDGALPPPMAAILDQLQQFIWTSADDNDQMVTEIAQAIDGPAPVVDAGEVSTPVGGAVPIDSKLYVVRPTDDQFHRAVSRKDSIVLVKGARQMGKTSLLARGLQQARDMGVQALFTDLQALSPEQVSSPEEFFLAMAYSLADQMDLDVFPEERWTDRLGPGVNFERYLRRVVLADADHVLWALDEVDRMFITDYASEVFGLFRSWHNKRALDPDGPWSRLTLAIAYATEAHLFITDVNQSPFNVGTRLELADFDVAQIAELNRRHGAPLSATDVDAFARLVGGHPYLVQRGFQAFVEGGVTYATLEATAADDDGPYGDHLRRILFLLAQNDQRRAAVAGLTQGSIDVDPETFYHLRTAGLLTGASMRQAEFRNGLYADYLGRHLA